MVGQTGDPVDGKAVAGSIFAAVIVYAVRLFPCACCLIVYGGIVELTMSFVAGLPRLLRLAGVYTCAAE